MTWPVPVVPAFPAGYSPQQADFTAWWYDNAGFMQNKVAARVSQTTTATTLPDSGAQTLIAFDTVVEDPYSGWVGSPFYEWRPPTGYSGFYQVTLTVRTAAVNGPDLDIWISNVAVSQEAPACGLKLASNVGAGASGTWITYLIGGQDSVAAYGSLLNATASLSTSLTAGQQSTMEIIWLTQS
jgi:hypothetical protein